jgi:hypothetical protein
MQKTTPSVIYLEPLYREGVIRVGVFYRKTALNLMRIVVSFSSALQDVALGFWLVFPSLCAKQQIHVEDQLYGNPQITKKMCIKECSDV